MLLQNDLLRYCETNGRTVRVLWPHPEQPVAFVIDVIAPDAMPEIADVDSLENGLKSGDAKLLTQDEFLPALTKKALSPRYRKIRDAAWTIIEDLVRDTPRIFSPRYRAAAVAKLVAQGKASRPTIYLYLRRYWQRGQTPNALLPDYTRCGGKGKHRKFREGVKRGRPREFGVQVGVNISEDMRRVFRVAVARYYVTNKTFTLRGAYDEMIKSFFCERTIDPDTGSVEHLPKKEVAESGFPSFSQFDYWMGCDGDRLEIKRERLHPRIYDKDLRGLLGTSTAEVWGPGARYQIDATIADVYLLSRIFRRKIIGRPVLYVVIDVFSRMIVGIYVGLEGPSWVGAMMALANTAADKVAFCRAFGKVITPEMWPCHFLPAVFLGDRGEMEGRTIETLGNNFNVSVENATAFRGDWKGIVEQRFRLLPAKFKPYVPGYIQSDYRARGGTDYRLDAVLDIEQFTNIIIECVLYYNNDHEISRYDEDRDLARDEVLAVPLDLWEWGIANRSGGLRQYPEDLVRFSLLPTAEATVTLNGIRLFGAFYTCARAIEERWFDRARQKGVWKVPVSYDPRDLDEICLHDSMAAMTFQKCHMTERSRAYKEMSMWEIEQHQMLAKRASADHLPGQQLAVANLSSAIESVVADAVKKSGEPPAGSAASRTKDIRQNRAAEKELNRQAEVFRFKAEQAESGKSGEVLQFSRPSAEDYSEPGITEIIKSLNKDDNNG